MTINELEAKCREHGIVGVESSIILQLIEERRLLARLANIDNEAMAHDAEWSDALHLRDRVLQEADECKST